MSLLHTALKKAEREGSQGGGERLMIDQDPPSGGGPNLRMYLLVTVAVMSLLFLAVRVMHRSSAAAPAVPATPLGIGAGPSSPQLMQTAARLLAEKKWTEAKEILEKTVIFEPRNVEAYNNLGLALKKLGERDEAVEQYRKALSIDPRCAECLNNLGALYLQDRQLSEAREQFQKAIEARPDYADPYFHLALLAEAEGKGAEARQNYQKFMELARGIDAQFLLAIQKRMASL